MIDGALRFGTTQHFTAVFAASEEVPVCEADHRTARRRHEVMRLTESPTCVVGTSRTEVPEWDSFTSVSQDGS